MKIFLIGQIAAIGAIVLCQQLIILMFPWASLLEAMILFFLFFFLPVHLILIGSLKDETVHFTIRAIACPLAVLSAYYIYSRYDPQLSTGAVVLVAFCLLALGGIAVSTMRGTICESGDVAFRMRIPPWSVYGSVLITIVSIILIGFWWSVGLLLGICLLGLLLFSYLLFPSVFARELAQ